MKFFIDNIQEFENWRYNLLLIAPGKGEAKKTVSRGFIRLELSAYPKFSGDTFILQGAATDDIMSISSEMVVDTSLFPGREVIWIRPEILKGLEPCVYGSTSWMVELESDPEFNQEFDSLFWEEHVLDSIYGEAKGVPTTWIDFNPDRFRKFSLLKPNQKMTFDFVEWADRDIIRWYQEAYDTRGVYVPASRG